MNTISFMTANYIARAVGYYMTGGWGQGDRATQEYYKPLATFAPRFEQILRDVRALGFDAVDIWLGFLHWQWATDEHVRSARDLLARYNFRVTSLAGGFGATPKEFEAACLLARALGTNMLGGNTPLLENDRAAVVSLLKRYDLKLGIENHPEKNPGELLAKIGDGGDGTLGTTVDTGWYGTQGYDAAKAIEELGSHIFLVHLKDVLKAGEHQTCRYGLGVVPLERCIQTLKRIGYEGAISVEHEPELYDPTPDIKASTAMLRGWLQAN